MSTTTDLLDRYKALKKLGSDSDVARALSVKPSTISNYRQGVRHGAPEFIRDVAIALGEKPEPWVLRVEIERSLTPETRKVWQEILQTVGRAAIVFLAVYTAISPTSSKASTVPAGFNINATFYTLTTLTDG